MWPFVEHIAESACDKRITFLRCESVRAYEVRSRKDRGGMSILFVVPCHSANCGMANQTR
jgi:hypothetical protein